MLKQYRYWFVSILAMLMVACGGGGSLENGNGDSEEPTYQISLSAVDSQGTSSRVTSQDNPLTVTATVTENGKAANNIRINFVSDTGNLAPSSGSVLVQNGLATIKLFPGQVESAGILTATLDADGQGDLSDTLEFSSLGDGINSEEGIELTADLYYCSETLNASLDNLSGCTTTKRIFGKQAVNLVVSLSDNGVPKPSSLVSLSLPPSVKSKPEIGEKNTDSKGIAIFELTSVGEESGAAISITSQNESIDVNGVEVTQFEYNLLTTLLKCTSDFDSNAGDFSSCNQISAIAKDDSKYFLEATLTHKRTASPIENFEVKVSSDVVFSTQTTDNVGKSYFELSAPQADGVITVSLPALNGFESEQAYVLEKQIYVLELNLANAQGESNVQLSAAQPLTATATLKVNGEPKPNAILTFNTNAANLSSGALVTDANGQAQTVLAATDVAGEGSITATLASQNLSETITYISAGDGQISSAENYTIDIDLFKLNDNGNEEAFPKINGIYTISEDNPAIVVASVLKNGVPIDDSEQFLVSYNNGSVGVLSPSSAVAVTDENGQARITLTAGSVRTGGQVTASATLPNGQVTSAPIIFETLGDDASIVTDQYKLTLKTYEPGSENPTFLVSKDAPVELWAKLTDNKNAPVENALLTFSSSLGTIFPNIATARTDSQGEARVVLTAGDVRGAGQAQVNYQDAVAITTFDSAGDEIKQDKAFSVTVEVYDCSSEGNDKEKGDCDEPDNRVGLNSPRTIIVHVTDNNQGIPNLLVNIETDNGILNPSTGRVLTNEDGYATADISMGEVPGAGLITVTLPTSTASGSVTATVDIGAVNIEMGNEIEGDFKNTIVAKDVNGVDIDELAPGRTAVLQVNIIDAETKQSYLQPVEVTFSSACASESDPKARIDSTVTAFNGVAKAVYVADGCAIQDEITATADIGSRSLLATGILKLGEVSADSVIFESVEINGQVVDLAENPTIGLKGNGSNEKARLNFRVVDEFGNHKEGQTVRFSLANNIGNTSGLGGVTISPSEAVSFSDGTVFATVEAGQVANPIIVIAELVDSDNNVVSYGLSRGLAAITGVGDQNSFTFVPESLNIEAWGIVGVENRMSVFSADHFNHPVLDGTSVTFRTDHGTIDGSCTTLNGSCEVVWRSTNPIINGNTLDSGFCDVGNDNDPSNDILTDGMPCFGAVEDTNGDNVFDGNDRQGPLQMAHPRLGRVTVLAYTFGEESFVDANGNGRYDSGETFYNLGEAFLDDNRDGLFCGQQEASSSTEYSPNADLPFAIDNINFAPGVDNTLCIKTARYGARAGDDYVYLGASQEEFVDVNNNGIYDSESDSAQHKFNGLSCTVENAENDVCSRNLVQIRDDTEFVMSGQSPYVRVLDSDSQPVSNVYLNADVYVDCNGNGVWDSLVDETLVGADCNGDGDQLDIDVAELLTRDNNGNGRYDESNTEVLNVYVTDINNNPMPAGTSFTYTTDNGEIFGASSYEVLETNRLLPMNFSVGIKPESEGNEAFQGTLLLTVETPGGVSTTVSIANVFDSQ
ncbi:Ig domain-containing protein group 1 domain-containing protein [Catenovulum agarivorans DS-2]|uniref:Ig domain-containing protein group 1 domain-containing protein n=1 Tax=Catenovulum agarivorans DS-2 TaxID=1328313 RepID=W7QKB8_9ALTE|nr:hypothetical protein [Catenovulum agarivorans]EWH12361.1 Ig domain-containing protein group 1 domain-containing protein [Catenovulum agarivorans DS-2]